MSEREPIRQAGFLSKLRTGLSRSANALADNLSGLFNKKKLDAETVSQLAEALVRADVGSIRASNIADAIAKGRYDTEISEAELKSVLAAQIASILKPVEQPFVIDSSRKPFVILVVGVNGTGKTTTIGKLAQKFSREGNRVMLAAGDTFRAAAVEQLQLWGARTGCQVFARGSGADSAGLAFDALAKARSEELDVLLIDTAGRLQNKADLMAELTKIVRVLKKLDAETPHAVLLVLDATVGQNAISQLEIFKATVPVTGLVMTKLDGTAKGGILIALADRFELPIAYVGVGEGPDDLQPFSARAFAEALTGAA
ncbi:MAG TPA: signal recognition particle-docking protein FtsY [Rhizomicrobium sp.]|nr:signal recognition particle-docking protein FtsY [Rhizomicrobium sp.]